MADPIIPYPIEVQLSGTKIEDVAVKVTNGTTGETITIVTDSTGYALGDASNFPSGYSDGDIITASAIDYSTDFNFEITDNSTRQQIRKETSQPGTGTIVDLTPWYSINKLDIIISAATTEGNYELHILYEG